MSVIRSHLFRYLDAKQHLWNTYFLGNVRNLRECEPLDSFEAIDKLPFRAFVCQPSKISLAKDFVLGIDSIPEIIVRPKKQMHEIELQLNRSVTESRRWLLPSSHSAEGAEFEFIEFFQWNSYDFLSMGHIRCSVNALEGKPGYRGRQAIIEHQSVDFELT